MNKVIKSLGLLKLALKRIHQNPIIFYPTAILALVQFLLLEILYFSPRYPLSQFFSPFIRYIWSEDYLHYPMDLVLLPKLFYYGQLLIYLFLGSFLSAVTTHIIITIHKNHRVILKTSFREASRCYIQVFFFAIVSFTLFHLTSSCYSAIVNTLIKSNHLAMINPSITKILILVIPYVHFLNGIIVTALLIYIVPIVIMKKNRILSTFLTNLKFLFMNFRVSFLLILFPTLLYLPVLVARNNTSHLINHTMPEIQIFIIILGIFLTMLIDLIVLTAVTINYLSIKDS